MDRELPSTIDRLQRLANEAGNLSRQVHRYGMDKAATDEFIDSSLYTYRRTFFPEVDEPSQHEWVVYNGKVGRIGRRAK